MSGWPCFANCRASSKPIPLEAPVMRAVSFFMEFPFAYHVPTWPRLARDAPISEEKSFRPGFAPRGSFDTSRVVCGTSQEPERPPGAFSKVRPPDDRQLPASPRILIFPTILKSLSFLIVRFNRRLVALAFRTSKKPYRWRRILPVPVVGFTVSQATESPLILAMTGDRNRIETRPERSLRVRAHSWPVETTHQDE